MASAASRPARTTNGRAQPQVVDDHVEDALDVSRVVRRGEPLRKRPDRPAENDGADLVDRYGNQPGMSNAGIAAERGSHFFFYAAVGEHGGVGKLEVGEIVFRQSRPRTGEWSSPRFA
jgi:hypothetical protein